MNELENLDIRGSEAKASCPFARERHEAGHDVNPSMSINFDKGTYYCPVCHSKGNIHTYLKDKYKMTSDQAWFKLGDTLVIERPDGSTPMRPDIDPGLIGLYHRQLMALTGPIRKVLREKRGFTDKTLVDMQIGWDGERLTFPIYDEYNRLVNIRRYKWDAPEGQRKVLNYSDEHGNTYGELRVYGIDNLIDDNIKDVVWCEGETDRVLSEQHGFPAACPTSGAGSWDPKWLQFFRNKRTVYICQDNDEAGRNATAKICDRLQNICEVKYIKWSEDFLAKGDITDFYISCNKTSDDFQKLLDEAQCYTGVTGVTAEYNDANALSVHLADSSNANLHGKRVKVPVLISGKDTSPFVCPKSVTFFCGDKCDLENDKCKMCQLSQYGGEHKQRIEPTDPVVMKLIKCSEESQFKVLKETAGANGGCKVLNLTVDEFQNVEEVRLIPKAETELMMSKDKEYVVRLGYIVDTPIKTNKRYTLYGAMYPEPGSQYASYVFDRAVPDKDLASDFEMSEEMHEKLKMFQPKEGQSIDDKINEIHVDIERNVTKVWERRDVAIAIDLTYNSVLSFYFQDSFIRRGWVELLIIGDSGQAKSTMVERIMQHYKLGEMISGESSKRTGLIYSLQQTQRRWMLQWGAFPLNDGGLLAIDELSGVSEDDLALMSDVRTSGVAKVTGVITSETNARTRVIYTSNPRNGKPLNTEPYGVQTVLKLWGKTEDVRRLDLAMAVASGDVDPKLINRLVSDMPELKHVYVSDICKHRVMWAWSRGPDDVEITESALKCILNSATAMGERYSSKIPIVEAADQRLKIARLSISCAAMLFSTDSEAKKIIVTEEHVKWVVSFLTRIYSKPSFAYDRFSDDDTINSDCSEIRVGKLRKAYCGLPLTDFNGIAEALRVLPYLDRSTISDYTGLVQADIIPLIRFLTTEHLIERCKGGYRRTPVGMLLFDSIRKNVITKEEINEAKAVAYGGIDEY